MYRRQRFNVLDSETLKVIGVEPRSKVHRSGDWHRATTAFIVRRKNNVLSEVLVQKRSGYVDIAQYKLDQSLATQVLVEDGLKPTRAILRGLAEELGVNSEGIHRVVPFNVEDNIKLVKRYGYNKDLWNREFVTSYGVVLKKGIEPKISSERVKELRWLPWENFVELLRINPRQYTKTSRLFCTHEAVVEEVERFFERLLDGRDWNPVSSIEAYVSLYSFDVLIFKRNPRSWDIEVYNTEASMKSVGRYSGVRRMPLDELCSVTNERELFSLLSAITEEYKRDIRLAWRH